MKLLIALVSFIGMTPCFADPGITIEIDIFIDKPSGPGEVTMG